MAKTVHHRCIERAAALLGGEAKLAAALKVSETKVRLWLAGGSQVPAGVFLHCVDIILQAPERRAEANDPRKSNHKKCG
jgi:hypothetical protein